MSSPKFPHETPAAPGRTRQAIPLAHPGPVQQGKGHDCRLIASARHVRPPRPALHRHPAESLIAEPVYYVFDNRGSLCDPGHADLLLSGAAHVGIGRALPVRRRRDLGRDRNQESFQVLPGSLVRGIDPNRCLESLLNDRPRTQLRLHHLQAPAPARRLRRDQFTPQPPHPALSPTGRPVERVSADSLAKTNGPVPTWATRRASNCVFSLDRNSGEFRYTKMPSKRGHGAEAATAARAGPFA